MLIFDLETEPLPDDQLRAIYQPMDDAKLAIGLVTGEFDPASVRTGNMKDQAKIDAKVAEARESHEKAKADSGRLIAERQEAHWQSFVDGAALSAVTGRCIAVGYHNPIENLFSIDATDRDDNGEAGMVGRFWGFCESARKDNRKMLGVNIHDFDLPFLVRRSWILGVDVPDWVITQHRFFADLFVDLRKVWLCGQHSANCPSSFDLIGRAMGTGGKNGASGKDFAKMWKEDRKAAVEYLKSDLKQPAVWARKWGLL